MNERTAVDAEYERLLQEYVNAEADLTSGPWQSPADYGYDAACNRLVESRDNARTALDAYVASLRSSVPAQRDGAERELERLLRETRAIHELLDNCGVAENPLVLRVGRLALLAGSLQYGMEQCESCSESAILAHAQNSYRLAAQPTGAAQPDDVRELADRLEADVRWLESKGLDHANTLGAPAVLNLANVVCRIQQATAALRSRLPEATQQGETDADAQANAEWLRMALAEVKSMLKPPLILAQDDATHVAQWFTERATHALVFLTSAGARTRQSEAEPLPRWKPEIHLSRRDLERAAEDEAPPTAEPTEGREQS